MAVTNFGFVTAFSWYNLWKTNPLSIRPKNVSLRNKMFRQ